MMYIISYRVFDLSSLIILAIIAAYFFLVARQAGMLIRLTTVMLVMLCFYSPLHLLSAHYLFSAHMIVHVILLLCLGPLLVLALKQGTFGKSTWEFLKKYPVTGWLAGMSIMWLWHIPVLFNASMAAAHQDKFHIMAVAEPISLITGGILFSAPVIHPIRRYRIDALAGVVYLFTACIGCSLLGLLITFAPPDTYHHFLSPHDEHGLNDMILHRWNITQYSDQQAAGLIMWVPCCMLYVTGAMYLLVQWFRKKEDLSLYSKQT